MKKILIVDDMAVNLEYLKIILEREGYTVETAEDGGEALEKVRGFLPDLIILDNIMPKMTGAEIVRVLKREPFYRHIKILMVSAADEEKLDVDAFLSKPLVMPELLSKVREILCI